MKKRAKKKNKMKNLFNFSFRDLNQEIQIRNYKIFDASLKAFFLYLLIILPIFAFTYIMFANNNLLYFVRYLTNDGKHIWQKMDVSNGFLILGFWIVGFIFLVFTLVGFLLFKPIVTGKRFPKTSRYLYIIVLAVIALLAIFFFGLSQFEYSRFYEYYRYSVFFTDTSVKLDWAKPLADYFIANHKDGIYQYGWTSNSMTLWMMFGQMIISFASFLVMQNSIFIRYTSNDLKEENYILLNPQQHDQTGVVINNRFFRALKNFFRNDQKNLTIYIIIGSIIVLLSSFVYSILLTSSTTNSAAMVNWSYRISYLFSDLKGFVNDQGLDGYQQVFGADVNDEYYGSLFSITSLPIIFFGLTISVLFFFILVFVREKRVSYRVFTIQTGVLFGLIIITISSMLASKVLVYDLQYLWNLEHDGTRNNIAFKNILEKVLGSNKIDDLFKIFKENGIFNEEGFKIEWLSRSSNVADAIITYTFVIGLFSVVTINNNYLRMIAKKTLQDLKKLKKNKKGGPTDANPYQNRTSANR